MGNALVCGVVEAIGKSLYRAIYHQEPLSSHPIEMQRKTQPSLELSLFGNDEPLLVNRPNKTATLDPTKRLLVGMVKPDNQEYFLELSDKKIYYTGKTKSFPSIKFSSKGAKNSNVTLFLPTFLEKKGMYTLDEKELLIATAAHNYIEKHPEEFTND